VAVCGLVLSGRLGGLSELQVRPEATVSESVTVPVSPLILVIVMVPAVWVPTTTVVGVLAVIVKSE